jgi:hypothetical protein
MESFVDLQDFNDLFSFSFPTFNPLGVNFRVDLNSQLGILLFQSLSSYGGTP